MTSQAAERRRARRRRDDKRVWLRVLAWTVLVLFIVWGFARIENANDRAHDAAVDAAHAAEETERVALIAKEASEKADREALARDYTQCFRGNVLRATLREYIASLVNRDGGTPSEGQQFAIAQANKDFADVTCPPPPTPTEEDIQEANDQEIP